MPGHGDVAAVLDGLCQQARSTSATQASQMGATQRAEQHLAIRWTVLEQSDAALLQHVNATDAGSLSKHAVLLLGALTHVAPQDDAAAIATCQARLATIMLAILKRTAADDDFVPHAAAIIAAAAACLSSCGTAALTGVIDLAVGALRDGAPAASQLLQLLPACVSVVVAREGESGAHVAKAHAAVKQVCALAWPQADTLSILQVRVGG